MKKLCMFIVTLCLIMASCDQNDNEGLNNKTREPLPSSIADLEYEDFIGTWDVLGLCKDGESKFTSLDTNLRNELVFNEKEINVRVNVDYGNNNKFSEECNFIKYNHFDIVDGIINGYLNPVNSVIQVMFEITNLDSDTGIITIKNKQTRSSYKIVRRSSIADDNNNNNNPTVLYSTYEDFKGVWDVLEIREKEKTEFLPVDNSYINEVLFDKKDIKIEITMTHEGGKAFGEFCDFTNFAYCWVKDGKIFGYSEKDTAVVVFDIINIDADTKVVTIKNELTKTTYKMIKQNK